MTEETDPRASGRMWHHFSSRCLAFPGRIHVWLTADNATAALDRLRSDDPLWMKPASFHGSFREDAMRTRVRLKSTFIGYVTND